MELVTVYDCSQSAPLYYDNTTVGFSEVTANLTDLGVSGDWTDLWMGAGSEQGSTVTTTELQDAIHHWLDDVLITTGGQYRIKAKATDNGGATGEDESDDTFMIKHLVSTPDLQLVIVEWLK